jgi:hypothetical protein
LDPFAFIYEHLHSNLSILPKELRVALNAIGKRYSEEDVARVVATIDTDGNGKVWI